MIPEFKIKVEQGRLEINSIEVLEVNEHYIHLMVNTDQPDPCVYSKSPTPVELSIYLNRIGFNSPPFPLTKITIDGLEGDWSIISKAFFYGIKLIIFKEPKSYFKGLEDGRTFEHLDWNKNG